MSKKGIFIAVGIIIVFIFIVTSEEKEIDWTATYNETSTKPLDTKIFFEQLPSWFGNEPIKKVHLTFYEYYTINELYYNEFESNYISVSEKFKIDGPSFQELLYFVQDGNNAFISAHDFPPYFKDSLNIIVKYDHVDFGDEPQHLFLNYKGINLAYKNKVYRSHTYFKDTLLEKKLGYYAVEDQDKKINFVAVHYGDGIFYLHTNPEIFTNYQLLESKNTDYISHLVSYLPKGPVYYNRTQKYDPELSRSALRFIFSQEALKWAWILMLIGIGLFMYFNGKRKQRIIPIVPPIKNTTIEFVKTVSNLFFEADDYNNIIHKKINYFLEHVRSFYHLATDKLDEEFVKKLASKSGNSVEDVQSLVTMISKMRDNQFVNKTPLITLNKKIEDFYKK